MPALPGCVPPSYFGAYELIVPLVFIVFPSTVLFPRDIKTDVGPVLKRPVPLSVTVESETRTVAMPVE